MEMETNADKSIADSDRKICSEMKDLEASLNYTGERLVHYLRTRELDDAENERNEIISDEGIHHLDYTSREIDRLNETFKVTEAKLLSYFCNVPGCEYHSSSNIPTPTPTKREESFSSPPKRRTIKRALVVETAPALETNNKFQALSNHTLNAPNIPLISTDGPKSPNTNNKLNTNLPPIMMKIPVNIKLALSSLNDKFPGIKNKLAGEYIKIFPRSAEEYRAVIHYLEEATIDFFVIKPKDARPVKVVIKGLPITTPIPDIEDELKALNYNPIRITQLHKLRTRKPLPIFHITLERDDNIGQIYKEDKFLNLIVIIEPFKGTGGPSQCHRCNRFGHGKESCHMKARCLKCSEEHLTVHCPIKSRIENPICINCNAEGHIASWRGCPDFPKLQRGSTQHSQNNQFNSNRNRVQANFSFANATRNDRPPQIAPNSFPSASYQTQPETSHQLNHNQYQQPNNTSELMELFKILQEISASFPGLLKALPELRKANNNQDKLFIVMNALIANPAPATT